LGVDFLVVLPFTKEMAALSARDFMAQVLKERLNVKMLQVGYDNRFGHDSTEGIDDYRRYGDELGIMVYKGIRLDFQGYHAPVCSSNIRSLIAEEGEVDTANMFLGRNYELSGKVMPGEHIGHQLGFPTANLEPDDPFKVIPASGVYGVWATVGDSQKPLPAMMNIGTRPTFDGRNRTLEVNIFDFDGDLYGQTVRISFLFRLREERKFESPEALVAQLQKDKEQVLYILNKVES
jgi:riboflavin kinase/FMN adenylyltransferase